MPEYIRGILNLRGQIVPIMCLRRRFNLQLVQDTSETCIIVVEYNGTHTGIVVDKVSEVVDVKAEQIEEVPDFGNKVNSKFLNGIAKSSGSVKMLINITEVIEDGNLELE